MYHWRNTVAVGLVPTLLVLSLPDSLTAKPPPNPTFIKQRVDLLGVHAKVKVKLADGKKLRGYIEAIEDDLFLLDSERQPAGRRVAYDEVVRIETATPSYRAAARPDPVEARRVVRALGVGMHVMVKITGGKKLRGHIEAVDSDNFTLRLDREGTPVQIAYNEVWQVRENASKVLQAVVVVVVLVITYFLVRRVLSRLV